MREWNVPVPVDCTALEPSEDPTPEELESIERWKNAAVSWLYRLTGSVFGVTTETVRPCFRSPDRSSTYRGQSGSPAAWWPGLISGTWNSGACGCRDADCACGADLSRFQLPGPVVSVEKITIDGAELDATAYGIQDNRWIVRLDGGAWPQDQDLTAGPDEDGSFIVTYRRGIPVPVDGQIAAGALACDIANAELGNSCAIPDRASSVSRQGINIELLDPAEYFENGLTGISAVDRWILTVNPGRRRGAVGVFSPDVKPKVTRIR